MGEAETVVCVGCGAAVPLASLAASVVCPFCRRPMGLSPHDVQRLTEYRRHVEGRLDQAQRELGHAETWDRWYGSDAAKKKNKPWMPVVIWMAMVIPMVILGVVAQSLHLPSETLSKLMPFAIYGIFFLVIGSYMIWYYSGRSRHRKVARAEASLVRCPQCGAPQPLQPGEVLERCRYCAAVLLPDAGAMAHGRAQAERALLAAELERFRAERRGMAGMSKMSASNSTPYIVLGSFLPMTGFGAIGATVSFIQGDRDAPLAVVALAWSLLSVNGGLLALVVVYRRWRRERWERLVKAQFARFPGAPLADLDAVNVWFDRHWAGAVPVKELFPGPCFMGLALEVAGYPVLVVCNPVGVTEHYPGYLRVRVGAWLEPAVGAGVTAVLAPLRHALGALGLGVEAERAGLVISGDVKAAKRLAAGDPRALGDPIAMLAEAARQLGAAPVRAGPG